MASELGIAERAELVTLRSISWTNDQVANRMGIAVSTVSYWFNEAKRRGYDSSTSPLRIKDGHVTSTPRSGRPLNGILFEHATVQSLTSNLTYFRA